MLDDYIRQDLSTAEAAAVADHIKSCPDCAAELASQKALMVILRNEPDLRVSGADLADFLPGVWQKIESRRRFSIRKRFLKFVPALVGAMIISVIFLRPLMNVSNYQTAATSDDSSSLQASYHELLDSFLGSRDSEYVDAIAAEVFSPSYTLSGDDLDYYLQQIDDEDVKIIEEKLDKFFNKAG
jgi:hypothetical protein